MITAIAITGWLCAAACAFVALIFAGAWRHRRRAHQAALDLIVEMTKKQLPPPPTFEEFLGRVVGMAARECKCPACQARRAGAN